MQPGVSHEAPIRLIIAFHGPVLLQLMGSYNFHIAGSKSVIK